MNHRIRKSSLGAAFLSLALLPTDAGSVEQGSLKDPETEIALALTDLDNLHKRLIAAKAMSARNGLGPTTWHAEKAFANAKALYDAKEYLSAIRELNRFLNLTQVPSMRDYLPSQYMLGRSYEEIGFNARALRAYSRYLSAFLTTKEKNYDELLDVLKRMIPLAAGQDAEGQRELEALLSSVTNLELPSEVRPTVLYLTGKAAAGAGRRSLAETWLEQAVAGASDKGLSARALYIRALLALSAKDYEQAEELLGRIMAMEGTQETRDLARLALARLSVHRRKPTTALKYYALIPEDSPSFEDALFESVYTHLEVGQNAEARTKALLYLARFPEGAGAFPLKSLLTYLDLKAGNMEAAAASLATADEHLGKIGSWMSQNFAQKTRISHIELSDLLRATEDRLAPTPTIRDAYTAFSRLAELKRRLADARGNLRNVVYTIGRTSLAELKPQWVNRAEQLAKIGDDLLTIGHRLAGAERHLYASKLDPVDARRLAFSEERRTRLTTAPAAARRKMAHWASYANFLDLTAQIAEGSKKLAELDSELAAARLLAEQSPSEKAKASRQARLEDLTRKSAKLRESLDRSLEILREQKVADLLVSAPHRVVRKFLTQYAVALDEEQQILARAREKANSGAPRLLSEDADKAWTHWRFLTEELYRHIDELDEEVKGGLDQILGEIEAHETRYTELEQRFADIVNSLETRLGQSLASILDQYNNQIRARQARHEKWKADIEWLTYTGTLDQARALTSKYELERQILKDNLTDLQQGVLWQWPE